MWINIMYFVFILEINVNLYKIDIWFNVYRKECTVEWEVGMYWNMLNGGEKWREKWFKIKSLKQTAIPDIKS